TDEPQLAVRKGELLAPRLMRAETAAPGAGWSPTPDGTVLTTGGTGALGARFAKQLAERPGTRHLLLVSRRGPAAEGVAELVAEPAELGAGARRAACHAAGRVHDRGQRVLQRG
ncbi:hypothetical protein VM98_36245, partial [Streptomyces rubellomurinus subsp. indigoferus]